ncbi:MAG: hypothetical protein J7J82_04385 [Staphylothermus sp.]|nr:hypothetical protein [Staphylothermus sp.]
MSAKILAGVLHGVISVYLLGDQIIAGVGFDSFSNEKSYKSFTVIYILSYSLNSYNCSRNFLDAS